MRAAAVEGNVSGLYHFPYDFFGEDRRSLYGWLIRSTVSYLDLTVLS